MPTNLERIQDELRKRQQAGTPAPDRSKQGTARTPSPFDTSDVVGLGQPLRGVVPGAEVAADQAKLSAYDQKKQADAAAEAKRVQAYDQQQREKNRQRGRASTMATGGAGDTSNPLTARASLYGY
jgi:hypothetical protein